MGGYQAEEDKPFPRLADSNCLWAMPRLLQLASKRLYITNPRVRGSIGEVSDARNWTSFPWTSTGYSLPAVDRLEAFPRIEFPYVQAGSREKDV